MISENCEPLPIDDTLEGKRNRKYAFVTLLSGDETAAQGYLSGAKALSHSLDAVGSKVHRICMVTGDVPQLYRNALVEVGYEVGLRYPIFQSQFDSKIESQI